MRKGTALPHEIMCDMLKGLCNYFLFFLFVFFLLKNNNFDNGLNFAIAVDGLLLQTVFGSQFLVSLTDCKPPKGPK